MIRSGFRYCFAIGENFGVRPQVSHTVALTPPIPASRLAAFANEVFETWAAPSFSPPLHQKRIAAPRPSAAKFKSDFNLIRICDASGCGRRFGPDGTVGKDGEATRFSEMAFRPREMVTVLKGEMNSGENRCRTPWLFRRANARVKSSARNRFRGHEHHCSAEAGCGIIPQKENSLWQLRCTTS